MKRFVARRSTGLSAFVALAVNELLGDLLGSGAALDSGGQARSEADEQADETKAQWGDVDFGDVLLDGSRGRAGDILWRASADARRQGVSAAIEIRRVVRPRNSAIGVTPRGAQVRTG
jgi:hypothetical protein